MGFNPCCCWSLRFGSIMIGAYTILYGVLFMAVMAWRTAEISYKRDRMMGTLKPYEYEDVRRYPGSYNIYYRSPEVAWYTAIWILDIIRSCVLFFVICGGVTLIWGVKAVIYWLVWFWVVAMSTDILFSFAHAIAWWTSQIRTDEQQVVLPVFEVIFAMFHLYLLFVIFRAYKAMKRGDFSRRKEKYRPSSRQVVVDHSYDYDPFGAVFIDPYQEPKKAPPPTYYMKEDYSIPVRSEPHIHVRPPNPGGKKSVETYFTEPARYSPPPPLEKKEMPTFEETEAPFVPQPKFDRNPTPLPPKQFPEDDSVQDILDEKERKMELNDQLHTSGPLNMDDLRLDYEPSEDSIKPPRQIITLDDIAQQNREREKEKKDKKKHKKHHHRGNSRDRDRDRHRDRKDRDRRDRDRGSRSHHRSRSHRHSRSPDRPRRSSNDRDRDRDRSDRRNRRDRRDRDHKRSRSTDERRDRRRRRSRRRSSSPSSSSSASPDRQPGRQASMPIITRPSSGEDSGLQSNALPQPYLSDSDNVPRNLQINSEIQISYPRPQPPGTAGTQLPLYTKSIPAAPK